jgi:hypothetical protein
MISDMSLDRIISIVELVSGALTGAVCTWIGVRLGMKL